MTDGLPWKMKAWHAWPGLWGHEVFTLNITDSDFKAEDEKEQKSFYTFFSDTMHE